MGVKTDKNGFLTEDGLVAFYRDFGHLGHDIEAGGVSAVADASTTRRGYGGLLGGARWREGGGGALM